MAMTDFEEYLSEVRRDLERDLHNGKNPAELQVLATLYVGDCIRGAAEIILGRLSSSVLREESSGESAK